MQTLSRAVDKYKTAEAAADGQADRERQEVIERQPGREDRARLIRKEGRRPVHALRASARTALPRRTVSRHRK